MSFDPFILAVGFTGILVGVPALALSVWAIIEVRAMKNSTHSMIRDMAPIEGDDFDAPAPDFAKMADQVGREIERSEDSYMGFDGEDIIQ